MENLITVNKRPYRALEPGAERGPLIVIDIGYSARRRTCGMIWSGEAEGEACKFGASIRKSAALLQVDGFEDAVLVLEAPLSVCHDEAGNPQLRAPSEKGRGWYYGAGAMTLIAAQHFLWELAMLLPEGRELALAEAFLSNKPGPVAHVLDARRILAQFWGRPPEELAPGAQPISPLIDGVPPVRVF